MLQGIAVDLEGLEGGEKEGEGGGKRKGERGKRERRGERKEGTWGEC